MKAIDLFNKLKDRMDNIPMVLDNFNMKSIDLLQRRNNSWSYYRAKLGSGLRGRRTGEFVAHSGGEIFFNILEDKDVDEKATIERLFRL